MFEVNKVVVDVPDCPTPPAPTIGGIPSWIFGWGGGISAVLVLALIVATAIVWYHREDEKTIRQRQHNDALVAAAKERKRCQTCGADYPAENAVR